MFDRYCMIRHTNSECLIILTEQIAFVMDQELNFTNASLLFYYWINNIYFSKLHIMNVPWHCGTGLFLWLWSLWLSWSSELRCEQLKGTTKQFLRAPSAALNLLGQISALFTFALLLGARRQLHFVSVEGDRRWNEWGGAAALDHLQSEDVGGTHL